MKQTRQFCTLIQETNFKDFCTVVDPRLLYAVLPKNNLQAKKFNFFSKPSIFRAVSEDYLFVRKGKLLERRMAKLLDGWVA
jgi:hypothetical protein